MAGSIHIWVPGIREGTGGIQAFSRTLVQAACESFPTHQVRVIVKNDDADADDPLRAMGVLFTSVAHYPKALQTPMMAAHGVALGLVERPDCVIAAHLHFLPALQGLRALTGIRFGGFLHGVEAWNIKPGHRLRALRAADRLYAVSEYTRSKAVADYGLPPERVGVVPNTLDASRFDVGPKPAWLLERYGLKPEQPVLLTVSRLALSERYKGHRQVLIALQAIIKKWPEVRYLIAGEGDDQPRLKAAVQAMGLHRHVIFAGHVPGAELPDHYRLCDIFLMPSTKEGFGIVFLEAMASGKPVIAGNMDGSVDALDGGRLGVLIDPNNPSAIATAVNAILSRTYRLPLLYDAPALRAAVVEQFGFPRVKGLLAEALRPLVEQHEEAAMRFSPPALTSNLAPSRTKNAPRIVVLTQLTSPYQVEFFNAVAAEGRCNLDVIYLTSRDAGRQWKMPNIAHSHLILSEAPSLSGDALVTLRTAELVVFNYYTDRFAAQAIRQRAQTGKPWVFWGERPGFMHLGITGRLARRVLLGSLHRDTRVPIWGVGRFALDGYRREFGAVRPYVDLPYFSDLDRFATMQVAKPVGEFRFMFSGLLSKRKGVDLLARAFATIAAEFPQARLLIVGAGPMESAMRSALGAEALDKVEWTQFTEWDALPQAYARGDVFCFPSRYDGWGLALVEALAAGLPVIGTQETGAALEFIQPGANGWMLPVDDLKALTNAMREAISMPPERLQLMAKAARQSVAEHSLKHGAHRFMEAAGEALQAMPVC